MKDVVESVDEAEFFLGVLLSLRYLSEEPSLAGELCRWTVFIDSVLGEERILGGLERLLEVDMLVL